MRAMPRSDSVYSERQASVSERRAFFKSLVAIVGPIAAQNLISAAVNSADVVMLGSVGQTAIAAASLAGQVYFVLFLIFTGLSSGVTMLSAQYWGKGDVGSIRTLMGIALRFSVAVGAVFAAAAAASPERLMGIFTGDEVLKAQGALYLRAVSLSFLFSSVSQIYQAIMKSVERAKRAASVTLVTLALNIFLNAVFIYGLFGAPRLGILGVAVATTISRALEMAACVALGMASRVARFSPTVFFRRDQFLFRDFVKFSLPALGNEFVWGLATAMYSVILGHLGEDIVAANSVVNVAKNFATILCFGMSYGGAILLGKEMGAGSMEKAERDAKRLVGSTALTGLLGAFMMIASKLMIARVAPLSETAARWRDCLIYINAFSVVGVAVNTVIICGVFRAGGDAKFGFVLDTVVMWCVSVPLGLLSAFVLKLPPVAVYLILFLDEFEKMPFVIVHFARRKWLRNITREASAD